MTAPRRGLVAAFAVLSYFGAAIETAVYAETGTPPDPIWQHIFWRPTPLPPSPEKQAEIALGRALFFDKRISAGRQRNCATCHDPKRAFTDGRTRALGRSGSMLPRNTPTLFGLADAPRFNWDGQIERLRDQFERPITHPEEMGGRWTLVALRLQSDAAFAGRLSAVFSERRSQMRDIVKDALAAYVGSLSPPRTRFDRWIAGEADALTREERAGFALFVGKGQCVTCHAGWRFTDDRVYDIGLAPEPATRRVEFKAPTLRELAWTAPYFHDGSAPTLADAIAHYEGGFADRGSVSSKLRRGLELSAQEREAMVAFLLSLSSEQPGPELKTNEAQR
jgi:cytochrome c peroxidase